MFLNYNIQLSYMSAKVQHSIEITKWFQGYFCQDTLNRHLEQTNILPDSFKHWRKTNILQGITIRKSSIIYSLKHWREVRSVGWNERWFIKWVVKFWGWSRLQKTIWSQIAPWPENIPPKGVSFSDLICIFAMSYQSFACFLFATLR